MTFAMPGPAELLIILAVLAFLFGASRLPKLARSVGGSLTQFKLGLRESQKELAQLEKETHDLEQDLRG